MDLELAAKFAREAMDEHGLTDWTFKFDKAVRRAGCTNFRYTRITLSRALTELWSEAEVLDTILHEIAHALVGLEHGHDWTWKRKCVEIGARPVRCTPASAPKVPGKYVARCPSGHVTYRTRKPSAKRMSCGQCARHFDPRYLLTWEVREAEN